MMTFLNTSKRENLVRKVQNKEAFTLIEMIITMAIILALSLFIYPVVIKAIRKGEETQCISQMRQLGIAMTMHLHDYGIYPKSARYTSPRQGGSIVDSLSSYIDNAEVYICPSSEEPFKVAGLSYIYNTEARASITTNQWLLVDARQPNASIPT